jgi:hypothetical protein
MSWDENYEFHLAQKKKKTMQIQPQNHYDNGVYDNDISYTHVLY